MFVKSLLVICVVFITLFVFAQTSYENEKKFTFNAESLNQCFIQAGEYYQIHPHLLWGIAKVESNFNPYALNKNKNGTYDIGLMQINSSWIPVLKNYGLKNVSWLWDPCYNIYVGAWILSQCIQKLGYTWEAVGCYNATSSYKRVKYSKKIYEVIKPYTYTRAE